MNWAAILLGYLGVFLSGITSLVALCLWAARHARAARVLFAAGLLAGAVTFAAALLSFLSPRYEQGSDIPLIVATSLALCLAGAGQFVAALRGGRVYAPALGCAVAAVTLTASPWLGCVGPTVAGSLGWCPPWLGLPIAVAGGLLLAAASVVVAVWPPYGRHEPALG